MTPEVRDRAPEPFFTTKEVGQGAGLGLSMIYGFLKQLGGHALIYSELGRGTRVSLFFPRSKEPAELQASTPGAVPPQRQAETILVVEDDPDVRLVTVSRLEGLGYKVRVAINGPSALEAVRNDPDIHVALLDVVVPGGMDGHQLADEFERIAPAIRLILMSGYSAKMAAGLDEPESRPFLSKPVSLLKLARTLRDVLEARR